MKPLLTLLLCVAVSTTFSQNNNKAAVKPSYQFVLLAHGLSAEKRPVTHLKDSAWGDGPYQFFKVIKTTDSVPAKLNTVFGIEFKIACKDSLVDVRYTQEWIYPTPMKEEDGRKYGLVKTNGTLSTNEKNSAWFTFSKSYELLKGSWILNLYVEDKLVYTHRFLVY